VCNLVGLSAVSVLRSVARKWIMKTSGNRLRRLALCRVKISNSVISNCSYHL
jgi:hypothetical protein